MTRVVRNGMLLALIAAWLGPAAWSCGPMGRELVGEVPEDPEYLEPPACSPSPVCDRTSQRVDSIEVSEVELALASDFCDSPRAEPCRLVSGSTAIAVIGQTVEECELTQDVQEIANRTGPLPRFQCARLNLTRSEEENDASPVELHLAGIELSHTDLTISSLAPFTVEMQGAALRDVTITLEGSIALRIARSVAFEGVRIETKGLSAARPRIELEEVNGRRLLVSSDERPFDGELSVTRSRLANLRLFASEVNLASADLTDFALDTERLDGTDVTFADAVLSFREAVLSASVLTRVEIGSCGSLTCTGSSIEQSRITSCNDGPFRSHTTSITGGFVDGPIEADRGYWNNVLVGLFTPTDLVVWDATMTEVKFCDQSRSLHLGGESSLTCAGCATMHFQQPDAVCVFPEASLNADSDNCPYFDRIGGCTAPSPPRIWP